MKDRYLYYISRGSGTYRQKITRETDSNIWIGATRISKKTMSIGGSGWNRTHYYEETPELIRQHNETQIKLRFNHNIGILEKWTDLEMMKKFNEFIMEHK